MGKLNESLIEKWHMACTNGVIIEDGKEVACDPIDFAECLNINSFHRGSDGTRYIWFEDGMYTYRPDGDIMCDTDGDMEYDIIETLEEYGIEFVEDEE